MKIIVAEAASCLHETSDGCSQISSRLISCEQPLFAVWCVVSWRRSTSEEWREEVSQWLVTSQTLLRTDWQCLSSGRHGDTSPDARETTWIIHQDLWADEREESINQCRTAAFRTFRTFRTDIFMDTNDWAIGVPVSGFDPISFTKRRSPRFFLSRTIRPSVYLNRDNRPVNILRISRL